MSARTPIQWTDFSWNPVVGCSLVSPGCTNCYAMAMAARIAGMSAAEQKRGHRGAPHYDGLTKRVNGTAVWTGKVALASDRIFYEPLRWKKPRKIFVNSMSDLFHESIPDEWIDRVFAIMAPCPEHAFQVLTKRAERMRGYMLGAAERRTAQASVDIKPMSGAAGTLSRDIQKDAMEGWANWPLPNVWLGVSAEDQTRADERIPLLLQTPAAVRFVSCEPLLGPIDLESIKVDLGDGLFGDCLQWHHKPYQDERLYPHLDWIIVGGESGPGARPMSIQWVRELRLQCAGARVPFFFKQWGEWAPAEPKPSGTPGRFAFGDYEHDRTAMVQVDSYPRQFTKFGARSTLARIGKKAAGRLLDGVEHNGFPERIAA